jgi:hypothetical protein
MRKSTRVLKYILAIFFNAGNKRKLVRTISSTDQ